MSTPDAQPCKHPKILTFSFADTGEPAGLWACSDCRRKFAPLDVESAAEIERLRADAARYQWLTHDGERIGERMRGMLDQWDGCDGKTGFDLAIDAAMRDATNVGGEA